jgi:hypothetical protein
MEHSMDSLQLIAPLARRFFSFAKDTYMVNNIAQQEIYLLNESVQYEGLISLGVYSTLELARDAAKQWNMMHSDMVKFVIEMFVLDSSAVRYSPTLTFTIEKDTHEVAHQG